MKVLVETSARHIHLSKDVADVIFGKGYQLKVKKELSQPGQFVCEEKITVEGAKGYIDGIAVLGPFRDKTQLELSETDARKLGIVAPLRESGDLMGSSGCKIVGPCGEYSLSEGVIVSKRHIHLTKKDADVLGVQDGDKVKVSINNGERSLVFGDVVVRESPKYKLAFHIDTDEANAAGVSGQVYGEIIV